MKIKAKDATSAVMLSAVVLGGVALTENTTVKASTVNQNTNKDSIYDKLNNGNQDLSNKKVIAKKATENLVSAQKAKDNADQAAKTAKDNLAKATNDAKAANSLLNESNDQTKVEAAKANVTRASQGVDDAKKNATEAEQQVTNAKNEVDDKSATYAKATQNAEQLQSRADQTSQELNNKQAEFDNSKSGEAQNKADKAQKAAQDAADAFTKAQVADKDAKDQLNSAGTTLKAAQNKQNTANNDFENAKTVLDQANTKLTAATKAQREVEAQKPNKDIGPEVAAAKKNVQNAQELVNKLSQKQTAVQAQYDTAQSSLNNDQANLSNTQTKLDQNKAQQAETQKQLQNTKSSIAKTQTTIDKSKSVVNNHIVLSQSYKDEVAKANEQFAKTGDFDMENADFKSTMKKASDESWNLNHYVSNDTDKQEKVDIDHITNDQRQELNRYTAALLNDLRDQVGTPHVTLNSDVDVFADKIAQNYVQDNRDNSNGETHDSSAINRAAKDMNLDYVKSELNNYGFKGHANQYYENLYSFYINATSNDNTAKSYDEFNYYPNKHSSRMTNMDDLKHIIFDNFRGFMFNGYEYYHAFSLLNAGNYNGYQSHKNNNEMFSLSLSIWPNNNDLITTHFITVSNWQSNNLNKFTDKQNKTTPTITDYQVSLTNAENDLANYGSNITRLHQKLVDLQNEETNLTKEVNKLTTQVNDDKSKADKIKNKLAQVTKNVKSTQINLTRKQAVLKNVQEKNATYLAALKDYQAKYNIATRNSVTANNVVAVAKKNLENKQTAKNNADKAVQQAQQDLQKAQAYQISTADALATAQFTKQAADANNEQAQAILQQYTAELKKQKAELNKVKTANDAAKALAKQAQQVATNAKQALANAKSNLTQAIVAKAQADILVTQATKNLAAAKQHVQDLANAKSINDKAQATLKNAQKVATDAIAAQTKADAEFADAKQTYDTAKVEVAQAQKVVDDLIRQKQQQEEVEYFSNIVNNTSSELNDVNTSDTDTQRLAAKIPESAVKKVTKKNVKYYTLNKRSKVLARLKRNHRIKYVSTAVLRGNKDLHLVKINKAGKIIKLNMKLKAHKKYRVIALKRIGDGYYAEIKIGKHKSAWINVKYLKFIKN